MNAPMLLSYTSRLALSHRGRQRHNHRHSMPEAGTIRVPKISCTRKHQRISTVWTPIWTVSSETRLSSAMAAGNATKGLTFIKAKPDCGSRAMTQGHFACVLRVLVRSLARWKKLAPVVVADFSENATHIWKTTLIHPKRSSQCEQVHVIMLFRVSAFAGLIVSMQGIVTTSGAFSVIT